MSVEDATSHTPGLFHAWASEESADDCDGSAMGGEQEPPGSSGGSGGGGGSCDGDGGGGVRSVVAERRASYRQERRVSCSNLSSLSEISSEAYPERKEGAGSGVQHDRSTEGNSAAGGQRSAATVSSLPLAAVAIGRVVDDARMQPLRYGPVPASPRRTSGSSCYGDEVMLAPCGYF